MAKQTSAKSASKPAAKPAVKPATRRVAKAAAKEPTAAQTLVSPQAMARAKKVAEEESPNAIRFHSPFRIGLIGTLGVGVGLLLITMITSLATVLTYIGVAFFLALGLDPAVKWLMRKGLKRPAAVAAVILIFLVLVVGIVWAVVPVLIEQIVHFVETFPQFLAGIQHQDWYIWITNQLGDSTTANDVLKSLVTFFKDPNNIANVAGGLLKVGQGVATAITGTIVVVILTIYFTAGLEIVKHSAYKLVPLSKRPTFIDLSDQITDGVGKYIVGQISLAALNGILSFIMLTIIGGKAAVLFAFIAFLLALIPLVGTVTATVVVTAGQLILASPMTALVILIYYLIYMQIEAYVISPRVMNKAVSIPGSLVVIAALAGGTLMGVLGALIAIPIAASILLIIKRIVMPAQERH